MNLKLSIMAAAVTLLSTTANATVPVVSTSEANRQSAAQSTANIPQELVRPRESPTPTPTPPQPQQQQQQQQNRLP